ncbi:MAG: glycosyltransferase [Deltaproteobacteria bacterium]|nr:glycosyltransferase [Deltaproteobacteria bacterium]
MIISTTLTGSNQDTIGEALASVVAQVDRCLVIDTGARDRTLEVARETVGDKLLVREFPWVNDFGAARNFALEAAADAGGTWAITVDTDERMIFQPGVDLRARLGRTRANVLLVPYENGYYTKERVIRLPAAVSWKGPTHEVLAGQRAGQTEVLDGVRFRELPKDEESAVKKFQRDAAILARYTEEHPDDPRWFYYLGASLHDLKRYDEAIVAFRKCFRLGGWPEESAWAAYRAAECHCALEQWDAAVETCALGLALRPMTAELAWLAGWASYKAARHDDAIAWSKMAIANGLHEGAGKRFKRIGFRYPPGLYEGPYDVLRHSFSALGDTAAAKAAEREFAAAKRAREKGR